MGSQALVHLRDSFLCLSLVCQRPAVEETTDRYPVWESLFLCETEGGCGVFLGAMRLATEQMEHSSSTQGTPQAVGVRNLLRERHHLLVLRQPLIRIAQGPQRTSSKAMAHHPSVLAI